MNKKEKEIADSMGTMLCESIDKLSAALKYHADVLGYYTDKINPVDSSGRQQVKMELATSIPKEDQPLTPTVTVTFEDLRAAVNRYAGDKGKDNTIAIVKRFTDTGALTDVKKSDYENLMAAVM